MVDSGIDIVVTSPTGHRSLIVEAKLRGTADRIEDATAQLREYMRAIGAEVGLIVGDTIRILRETYRGDPSIQVVGEFPIAQAHDLAGTDDYVDFEDRVQRWLEALRDHALVADEPLLAALREHVLPSLADGTVRAARPRLHHAAG